MVIDAEELTDVQNLEDCRGIAIDKVGISDSCCPITVLDRNNGRQVVKATVSMSVGLAHKFKGTHMSRFSEILNQHRDEMTLNTLPELLEDLKVRLEAKSAQVEVCFTYFLERSAPVTGVTGKMDYECTFKGASEPGGKDFILGVTIPVASLCPCSKEISAYGAHNQRGDVSIEVRWEGQGEENLVWIEDLVEIAERSASAPLYPVLKRPDEKYVTEQAYDNPKFVEDIVRDVSQELKADSRVTWFKAHVKNYESIHNHNAFAQVEWTRPDDPQDS